MGPLIPILARLLGRAAITATGRAALTQLAPKAGARLITIHAAKHTATQAAAAEATAAAKTVRRADIVAKRFDQVTTRAAHVATQEAKFGAGSRQHLAAQRSHAAAQTKHVAAQAKHAEAVTEHATATNYSTRAATEYAGQQKTGGAHIRDFFEEHVTEKQKSAREWIKGTSLGRFYQGIGETTNPAPANVQPPAGNSTAYPWLTNQQVMGMAGKPQTEIQQANDDAENLAKRQAAEAQLADSSKRLNDAFKGLMKTAMSPMKGAFFGGFALFGAAKALHAMAGAHLDHEASRYSPYNGVYSRIEAQRRMKEIEMAQAGGRATQGTADALNQAWLGASDKFNEISSALTNVQNKVLEISTNVAGATASIVEYLPGIGTLIQYGKTLEQKGVKGPEINARTFTGNARTAQRDAGQGKTLPPLPRVR